MKRRMISIFLLAALLLSAAVPAGASETDAPAEIYTPEDLLAMAENPGGSYILMEDLDMTGVAWQPLDFTGTLEGNGHAILNLTIASAGKETVSTFDGNRKEYETSVAGMFGTLRGAEVRNLQLLNIRTVVESDTPCFLGGLAGYAEDTAITDCTVTGCLELRAHDRMFGVGGVVGYGSGSVERCSVDVTLICVDTDAAERDEQFLGGVYAAGFMDVKNCQVVIDGYVSEHGYAHNGGIVGMYAEYPLGVGEKGYISNNSVTGKITFFEDNTSRRAYCDPFVGEAMVNRYYLDGNTEDFLRDERDDYSVELRPEMCAAPVYTETVVEAGCDTFGYTIYTCNSCGYCYADRYTLHSHTVTEWNVIAEATPEAEGLQEGSCDLCGTLVQEAVAPEPEETTEAATAETQPDAPTRETEPEVQTSGQETDKTLYIAIAAEGILLLAAILLLMRIRKNRRKRRKGKYRR